MTSLNIGRSAFIRQKMLTTTFYVVENMPSARPAITAIMAIIVTRTIAFCLSNSYLIATWKRSKHDIMINWKMDV